MSFQNDNKASLRSCGTSDELLAAMFKALGHPIRLQILKELAGSSKLCCGALVSRLPLAQSTVSQHLSVLKESGLIGCDVEGRRCCYWINADVIAKGGDLARDLFQSILAGALLSTGGAVETAASVSGLNSH